MALQNEESVSDPANHQNEVRNDGARGSNSSFFCLLLILLPVLAPFLFFLTRSFYTTGQNVIFSGQRKWTIDDIADAASTNHMETDKTDSIGENKLSASWNFVGVETSIDATTKPSQRAVVLGQETCESEEDKSLGGRKLLREERHENGSTGFVREGDDATVTFENADMQHLELLDSSILGKYSTWKKENEHKNLDSTLRLMRDQIIMARVYVMISKMKKKLNLNKELRDRLKRSRQAVGEANVDAELPNSAHKRIKEMAETLSKARDQLFDCKLVTRKLRAMILTEEEKIRRFKKQNTFLTQLGVKVIPGGIRCLSLRLTIDYYLLPPEKRKFPRSENLENSNFYHYALFSDNVLAAAVVVNSTVVNAKDSSKHVFHLVSDNLNFGAMKMWFLLNPPEEATIHVENLDEFKWLNSSYCPVLRQLRSAAMKEYYFKARNSSLSDAANLKYKNPKYLSMLNHLRFYLPQIYPKLDKVLFLDDDVVVQKDLTRLWLLDLEGNVNGAVETCDHNFHRFDKYLNFSDSHIAKEFDPNACGWAYGMNIFDLKEWKKKNITGIYHKWQNLNEDRLLWKLGTLPPGLMTFYGLTYPLEKSWHVLGLGYNPILNHSQIEKAAVIHYNGNMKPWLDMAITKYRQHWTKYVDYDHPYLRQCNFIK